MCFRSKTITDTEYKPKFRVEQRYEILSRANTTGLSQRKAEVMPIAISDISNGASQAPNSTRYVPKYALNQQNEV